MFTLKVKTAENNLFKFYQQFITKSTKYSLSTIKKTKQFYSVIRSPHANKNSQEQFNLVYYKYILKIPKIGNIRFKHLKHSLVHEQNISGTIFETKKLRFKSFF